MKKELLVAVLLAAIPGSAMAADLPGWPPAPTPVYPRTPVVLGYNWSGLYLGINGGDTRGRARLDFPATATTTGNFNTTGAVFGGTVGANMQFGVVVVGVEGDLDWANIRGSSGCPVPAIGFICQSSDTWLGTTRGRLGFASNEWLLYGTAGGAFGDVRAGLAGTSPQSVTRLGWSAGAGFEYTFLQGWSLKAEYLHVDLSTANCASCFAVVNVPYSAEVFRAGLNYRFGWGPALVARY
jgi:outer membrane immunogenic protein